MKRIVAFCHNQQLVVPLLLAVVFVLWQISIGRLTWSSFQQNPLTELFPALFVAGVLLIGQIWLAVKELNNDLMAEAKSDPVKIIHPGHSVRMPSKHPVRLIGLTLSSFVILAESLILERAYPRDFMTLHMPPSPRAPFFATVRSIKPPAKPPRLHVVRYMPMPYTPGRRLNIRMYVDNTGDFPLRVVGGSYNKLVDRIPRDYEGLKQLEQSLWNELESLKIPRDRVTNIPVLLPGTVFLDIESIDELTQGEIVKLASGASMYFMSVHKDENGVTRLRSCIRTVPSRDSVLFCVDPAYNIDDATRSRKTVSP